MRTRSPCCYIFFFSLTAMSSRHVAIHNRRKQSKNPSE